MDQSQYYHMKYLKYKSKYNKCKRELKQKGGAITKKYIIADGTSSAGKTTLCKHFVELGYKCIMLDDYFDRANKRESERYKTIPNEYISKKVMDDLYMNDIRELMVEDAIKMGGKALFDDVEQKQLLSALEKKKLLDDVFIIVVYTNLENLARNLESRRKEGDKRGVFAFKQFSERYIKADKKYKIPDLVNRAKFKKLLLDNFKYEFENEDELDNFAVDIFNKMDIDDDNDHLIKLRDEFQCNYFLITTGKSKQEIFNELEKI